MRSPLRELPSPKNPRAFGQPPGANLRGVAPPAYSCTPDPVETRRDPRDKDLSRVWQNKATRRIPVPLTQAPNEAVDLPCLPAWLHQRVVFAKQATSDRQSQNQKPSCDGRSQEAGSRISARSSVR